MDVIYRHHDGKRYPARVLREVAPEDTQVYIEFTGEIPGTAEGEPWSKQGWHPRSYIRKPAKQEQKPEELWRLS